MSSLPFYVMTAARIFALFGFGVITVYRESFGAEVIGINRERNRIKVLLTDDELGLFKGGDVIAGKSDQDQEAFKGIVIHITKDELGLKLSKGSKLPKRGTTVTLTPSYDNKRARMGPGWRAKSGKNQWDENTVVALEGGNGLVQNMLFFGGRAQYYLNNSMTIGLSYSQGSYSDDLIIAMGSMLSLRYQYFWGQSFNIHGGVSLRDISVTPLLQFDKEGKITAFDEATLEAQKDEGFASLRNQSQDLLFDLGIGNALTTPTFLFGNVLILGIDWLTMQFKIHSSYEPNPPNSYLEWAFPLNHSVTYYSRAYLGFSF